MANYQKSELYFLLTLLVVVGIFVILTFQPFIYPLVLAVILATVFEPVHKRILSIVRDNHGIAALLSTVFVIAVIAIPVAFLSTQIFKEATQLYVSLTSDSLTGSISVGVDKVAKASGIDFTMPVSLDINQYIKQGLGWLIKHLGAVFSNVAKTMVDVFILFIALYSVFKDGHRLKKSVILLSPLQDVYDETVFRKLKLAINGVVRGSISVSIIQGVLTAIGLTIFGVPNAVLWGSVAAIGALIPGVGTSLVVIPSIIFLFFTGANVSAVGLIVWGMLGVGLVDNYLGPKLVGRGVQLHPFLVLLSALGGVSLFGPLGVLFGPLVLSLLFVFLEIYAAVRGEHNK